MFIHLEKAGAVGEINDRIVSTNTSFILINKI